MGRGEEGEIMVNRIFYYVHRLTTLFSPSFLGFFILIFTMVKKMKIIKSTKGMQLLIWVILGDRIW